MKAKMRMKKVIPIVLLVLTMVMSNVGFLAQAAVAESATDSTVPVQPAGDQGTPPAMPEGMTPPEGGTPPDGMPMGEGGTPPEMPEGMTPPEGGMGGGPGGAPGGGVGGGSMAENSGTGATTITEATSADGEGYSSTADDENAIRVESGAQAVLSNISVSKLGNASNSEDSAFYGLNAAVLARDGTNLTVSGASIATDASGGNGIFSYGSGTTVTVSDTKITTTQGNSGGLMLAGGGTMVASNMDIETQGTSSAAIRTDRGGGTMTVSGGNYVTNGTGSPAVYSTAVVTVSDAVLTANASEAIVVEGKNSVTLTDCDVTGKMVGTYGVDSGENLQTVMIYQSMSGDADVGQSHFSMSGGSLTSLNGDTFYVTNTACTIDLSDVKITNATDGIFMEIAGNTSVRGWGKEGANGGTCEFTMAKQVVEGEIVVDAISSMNMSMTEGSSFTGTINKDGDAGTVNLTMDETGTWTLTADAHVTSFEGNLDNVTTNGFALYVNGTQIK